MISLLAIDPGAHTGWALFMNLGGWALSACGVCSPEALTVTQPDLVVIETPRIYPNNPARPADILKLRGIVGRYEERFRTTEVRLVEPHAWKGSVPGDIMCARIEAGLSLRDRRVLAAYTGGYRHNAVDAIGLGLWALQQPWVRKAA